MARFKKMPVEIEAMQVPDTNARDDEFLAFTEWLDRQDPGDREVDDKCDGSLAIFTLEGTMRADPGDWIIVGVKGELYPCKPDIFVQTYEPVVGQGYSHLFAVEEK